MIGTWTPPGVIITVAFDDEKLTLELVKKTDIPEDEPISWMTFDVGSTDQLSVQWLTERLAAHEEEHLRRLDEEMEQPRRQESRRDRPREQSPSGRPSYVASTHRFN
jgi:hypothetical protein